MTKSIQQVKQDLNNLKSAVAKTAIELEDLYRNYLELLNQSLKQQLILACYQICTQLYPKSFLDLSLSEKQDLQQNLRQIGIQLQSELFKIIEQKELKPEPVELNLMAELIKNLPKPKRRAEDESENEAEIDLELVKAELESKLGSELDNIEFVEIDGVSEEDLEPEIPPEKSLEEPTEEAVPASIDFENPAHLVLWCKQIERGIKKTLDTTSRRVNKNLQQAKILPNRIPHKVIEIAMQADSGKVGRNNAKQPNIPHVLHLVIESDKEQKSKLSPKSLQISLLRLRLAELEFSDHQLNAKRGKIRNLMGKIKTLNNKYEAIKQEEAVIEAQAAWRSSWYED